MNSIVKCPVCQQPLQKSDNKWQCDNQHHFDIARQGYCNLLLANQKKSREPGDSRAMLDARQSFLSAGYYQPVAEHIQQLVIQHYQPDWQHIADIGCGEGYYLQQLHQSLKSHHTDLGIQFYGTDISKEALKLAARRDHDINWFVAATKNLPFLDHQCDLLLNIFAPADWSEFQRVLKPGALVLLAVAGERHLNELKKHIYQEARPHQPMRFINKAAPWFELLQQSELAYELQLQQPQAVQQLLQMTPYFWTLNAERRQQIENLQTLTTPVNVHFFLMKARNIE